METLRSASLAAALALASGAAFAQGGKGTVYRCPGPPVLYTDTISAQEAKDKGCRTIEGAPITIVAPPKPRPVLTPAARPSDAKVEPAEQKARDGEARRILETELQKEEQKLDELKRAYNNGEPERIGGERNYQKYLDRVAGMKADIERKESDIAALKREIAKLPPP